MPVFLNGKSSQKSKKPSKSLTKYYPLLTGRPTSTIGWFSSANATLFGKFQSMSRTVDALIVANNGDSPTFTYAVPDKSYIIDMIALTNKNQFLIASGVPGDYSTYDVFLIGFEKMTTRVAHKQTNILVPVILIMNDSESILVGPSNIDPESWDDLGNPTVQEVLKNISMQELFDHATDYYFNTDMRQLLTDMPVIAKAKSYEDKHILGAYGLVKRYQTTEPFNPIQLGAFVRELTKNSADVPILNQFLLQFPELTFASLSEQFEIAAPTFKSL